MDYDVLAGEFIKKIQQLGKAKLQKKITDCMRCEAFMLQYIALNEGHALPSQISDEMNLSTARVAAALNSLEHKNLITRSIDPRDRRRILVELSPSGRTLAREHARMLLEETTAMLRMLGERDAEEYVRITGKLAEQTTINNAQLWR